MITKALMRLLCLVATTIAFASLGLAQGFSGAIWTTDIGGQVDRNLYDAKIDVYVNGGPHGGGNGALPINETFYIRVTAPNGVPLGTSVGTATERPVATDGNGNFVQAYHLVDVVMEQNPDGSFTGNPGFADTPNSGGEYKVEIALNPEFQNSKSDNFKVIENGGGGSGQQAELTVLKFYDNNGDGIQDPTDPFIPGWKIHVKYTTPANVVVESDEFTPFVASIPEGSTVEVTEYLSTGDPNIIWYATTATTQGIQNIPSTGGTISFGNRALQLGAGGGHTLGFWSNKNGQALIGADDRAMLTALNLVTGSGAAFDPGNNAALKTWLLDGNAVNMSYMLSVQLAAMSLNVYNGFVDGNALIYAPGTNSADAFGLATVNAVRAEANTLLGTNPVILSGDPLRERAQALKNALDNANNNLNFAVWLIAPPIPTFGTIWVLP